jgi:hypothetical protein
MLTDIDEGKYSKSVISDFLNWKDRIINSDSDNDDYGAHNIISPIIKYILSRNIPKDKKPDYEKLADQISQLVKIKDTNTKRTASTATTTATRPIATTTTQQSSTLIEDFFTALKISNSARREIE